jgi:hypothetical protein
VQPVSAVHLAAIATILLATAANADPIVLPTYCENDWYQLEAVDLTGLPSGETGTYTKEERDTHNLGWHAQKPCPPPHVCCAHEPVVAHAKGTCTTTTTRKQTPAHLSLNLLWVHLNFTIGNGTGTETTVISGAEQERLIPVTECGWRAEIWVKHIYTRETEVHTQGGQSESKTVETDVGETLESALFCDTQTYSPCVEDGEPQGPVVSCLDRLLGAA